MVISFLFNHFNVQAYVGSLLFLMRKSSFVDAKEYFIGKALLGILVWHLSTLLQNHGLLSSKMEIKSLSIFSKLYLIDGTLILSLNAYAKLSNAKRDWPVLNSTPKELYRLSALPWIFISPIKFSIVKLLIFYKYPSQYLCQHVVPN